MTKIIKVLATHNIKYVIEKTEPESSPFSFMLSYGEVQA